MSTGHHPPLTVALTSTHFVHPRHTPRPCRTSPHTYGTLVALPMGCLVHTPMSSLSLCTRHCRRGALQRLVLLNIQGSAYLLYLRRGPPWLQRFYPPHGNTVVLALCLLLYSSPSNVSSSLCSWSWPPPVQSQFRESRHQICWDCGCIPRALQCVWNMVGVASIFVGHKNEGMKEGRNEHTTAILQELPLSCRAGIDLID